PGPVRAPAKAGPEAGAQPALRGGELRRRAIAKQSRVRTAWIRRRPPQLRVKAGLSPAFTPYLRDLFAVQRRIDLGHFSGFTGLVRGAALVDARLAAEVEPQRLEVEALAAVGVDLFQRRQQLLLRRRPHVGGRGPLV